ncbi:hypothetical protein PORCRE_1164 [Porphyromonas crevioricanis JCM 15906]|uniref:Uncharacterized protein n=1 Tax=Porphyromonas crevioricanis JCM 15906 TaxID=1305617 RepID=T1CNP3_9PORP|nr:hypothetical protein PORCRE_1164 [Porphyromonas crevioricanis JCM 15906]GAD07689.1 hypothetical protein PORCAN_1313 [Porphyromonas crevioricanis JCM 13913]
MIENRLPEKQQATHQTNWLTGVTIVLTIQRPESRIELLPSSRSKKEGVATFAIVATPSL